MSTRDGGGVNSAEGGKLAVLVIDDDDRVLATLRLILTHLGHDCDLAATGREALSHLNSRRYDVVMLDLRLRAGDDARTILDAIERVAPGLAAHAVLCSGDPDDPLVGELSANFGIGILGKPFGIDDVSAAIDRARRAL